jgi:replication-associated recombination protein RarA
MFEGIDPSIGKILQKFVEQPETLSHLLFVGPPGSGKTTTAHSLVKAFYNQRKTFTGKALFLNSSDERSLEAVRSKVYPFARSQIHVLFGSDFFQKKAPKIIIFDEAETLTEQAQSALRPLLDKPASELLIIFLCNSISRIHSSILHRFLRIYFETPSADQFRNRFQPIFEMTHAGGNQQKINEISKMIAPADIYYRRGDIRFFLLQYNKSRECNTLGFMILHIPHKQILEYLTKLSQTNYIGEILTQLLFVFQKIGCISVKEVLDLLEFADADILHVRTTQQTLEDLAKWCLDVRKKFESSMA